MARELELRSALDEMRRKRELTSGSHIHPDKYLGDAWRTVRRPLADCPRGGCYSHHFLLHVQVIGHQGMNLCLRSLFTDCSMSVIIFLTTIIAQIVCLPVVKGLSLLPKGRLLPPSLTLIVLRIGLKFTLSRLLGHCCLPLSNTCCCLLASRTTSSIVFGI